MVKGKFKSFTYSSILCILEPFLSISAKTDCSSDTDDMESGGLIDSKMGRGSYSFGIGRFDEDSAFKMKEKSQIRRGTLVEGCDYLSDSDDSNSSTDDLSPDHYSTDEFTPNTTPFKKNPGIT